MPQFQKGQSGNPVGRKRAAQLAEEGNVAAIRICMNKAHPDDRFFYVSWRR
jgi:hypothetical protein